MKNKKKIMVIGIDGVPYELLEDFTQKGIMPNVKKLIQRYGLQKTMAPLPEISAVSWTSFMTGLNPGEHGIYGFMDLNYSDYSYTYPSFNNLPVSTIWEILAPEGKRSMVINLPGTYPARPINGILVSGFVAIHLEKAVYPITLLPLVKRMNYRIDADVTLVQTDKTKFLKDLKETLGLRYSLYKKPTACTIFSLMPPPTPAPPFERISSTITGKWIISSVKLPATWKKEGFPLSSSPTMALSKPNRRSTSLNI
jgi:predicted AlkP superfamily phosphohydrolase/phosphomutase